MPSAEDSLLNQYVEEITILEVRLFSDHHATGPSTRLDRASLSSSRLRIRYPTEDANDVGAEGAVCRFFDAG